MWIPAAAAFALPSNRRHTRAHPSAGPFLSAVPALAGTTIADPLSRPIPPALTGGRSDPGGGASSKGHSFAALRATKNVRHEPSQTERAGEGHNQWQRAII